MDSVAPGDAPDPGANVVSESRSQIGILFGFLSLAFALALARGVTGAQSPSGRASWLPALRIVSATAGLTSSLAPSSPPAVSRSLITLTVAGWVPHSRGDSVGYSDMIATPTRAR